MRSKVRETLSMFAIATLIGISSGNSVQAAGRTWLNSDQVTQRYCTRHRHGDYWHSCSDTRHPVFDQSHSHTGLPAYYTSTHQHRSGGLYFGVKSGSLRVDIEQADPGLPKAVVIGFGRGEYAFELEATSTSISSTAAGTIQMGVPMRFDSSYSTTAVYGVRRIGEDFYTKMKLGLASSRYVSDDVKHSNSNASAGFGFGLRFGSGFLEGEYTYIGTKAKLISIGASIVF